MAQVLIPESKVCMSSALPLNRMPAAIQGWAHNVAHDAIVAGRSLPLDGSGFGSSIWVILNPD